MTSGESSRLHDVSQDDDSDDEIIIVKEYTANHVENVVWKSDVNDNGKRRASSPDDVVAVKRPVRPLLSDN